MVDLEDLGKVREDEWFHRNEQKMIQEAKARRAAQLQAENDAKREQLRQAHWMKCPKCGDDLKEVEYIGIKIDKCTHCQGVFFDAGELDELLLKQKEERKTFFRQLTGLFSS
ncbi:MAG: zf-TFIIB domain-containing protein [Acidobacteriota bacterium]